MPVEVTPQMKNGTPSSQKSRWRSTDATLTGACCERCMRPPTRRKASTATSASAIVAANTSSAVSSETSSARRELGNITTDPAAVAAPISPNSAPCRSR